MAFWNLRDRKVRALVFLIKFDVMARLDFWEKRATQRAQEKEIGTSKLPLCGNDLYHFEMCGDHVFHDFDDKLRQTPVLFKRPTFGAKPQWLLRF